MAAHGIDVLVRHAENAEQRWFYGGGVHRWLATSADTGGAFMMFSDVMAKGKSTPLHTHPVDESLYLIEGRMLLHVDGREYELSSGDLALAPRGVAHAFLVLSDSATMLTLHTPGSCEAFYRGASEPITESTSRVVDFDRVRASAADNGGIEILGPPPFAK
jgi:quercetin dioxygenase-like cupin family protein